MECDEYSNSIMSDAELLVFSKKTQNKGIRKRETWFELDEDDYYIASNILYIIYYTLYYILAIKLLQPIITGNAFSTNYIEYEMNNALSVKEYLDMIKPYFSGIINGCKTQAEWEIYLIMTINFFIKGLWRNFWLAQSQKNARLFFD